MYVYILYYHANESMLFFLLRFATSMWIGLTNGAVGRTSYRWISDDSTTTSWSNWLNGQPYHKYEGVMMTDYGAWDDRQKSETRPFVCQTKASENVTQISGKIVAIINLRVFMDFPTRCLPRWPIGLAPCHLLLAVSHHC